MQVGSRGALALVVVANLTLSACRCGEAGVPDSGFGPDATIAFDAGLTSVLQFHRSATRDGFYLAPSLTRAAVASLHVDPNFAAVTSGQQFAQPLFMENGTNGAPTLYVATENDDVFALDATTGAALWRTSVGLPAPINEFDHGQCGSIAPLGITGTPVIDPDSRMLLVAAMVNGGTGGMTPTHIVAGLRIGDGSIAWTVDVASLLPDFNAVSVFQNQRGSLALVNGTVYVPYGGLDNDCAYYNGWVIGIPEAQPQSLSAWHTVAPTGGGIWGPSGIASDGRALYVATGNANRPYPTVWNMSQSNAILRLDPGPYWSEDAGTFFALSGPADATQVVHDWHYDDVNDLDLGSSGVVLVDSPGSSPEHLAFAIGKTQYTYLVNRENLGGLGTGLGPNLHSDQQVFGSLFAYNTPGHTFVGGDMTFGRVGCATPGADFSVLEVRPGAPPALTFAWCGLQGGSGSPIVSSSDGTQDVVLWSYGASGDEILRAYDAETGSLLFASAPLPKSRHWITPIVANGRVYIAGDAVVTALMAL